jgi:hypothetical protein
MKCLDCPLKYIGQTGRTFNIRYNEHIHAIRKNNSNSGYSNHILNTWHTDGTVTDSHSGGVESKLGPLGTSATIWPIVLAPGDCDDREFNGMKVGR